MEVYKSETQEILRRYRAGMLTASQAVAALDAAVVGLIPGLMPEQLKEIQAAIKVTEEALKTEAAMRGQAPQRKPSGSREFKPSAINDSPLEPSQVAWKSRS